jgi:hypothetical protein
MVDDDRGGRLLGVEHELVGELDTDLGRVDQAEQDRS